MPFALACGDVLPGCPATFATPDRETLLDEVAEHARAAHGVDEVTPELAAAVEQHVRET